MTVSLDTEFGAVYEQVKAFVEFTSVYPPSALYAGTHTPTPKEKKHEQRCIEICEELYSLECDVLREFRRSFREVEVQYMFFKNLKPNNLLVAFGDFNAHLQRAQKALAGMHKKDPVLNAYFNQNNLQLPMPVFHYAFHDWARIHKPDCAKVFTQVTKEVQEKWKLK